MTFSWGKLNWIAQNDVHPPLLWGPWRTGLGGSESVRLWPPGGGGGALFLERVELPLVHGWEPSGREVGGPVEGAGKGKGECMNPSVSSMHLTLRYCKYCTSHCQHDFFGCILVQSYVHLQAMDGWKDMYPDLAYSKQYLQATFAVRQGRWQIKGKSRWLCYALRAFSRHGLGPLIPLEGGVTENESIGAATISWLHHS